MSKKTSKSLFWFKIDNRFFSENKFLLLGFGLGFILLIIGIVQLILPQTSSNQIEIVSEVPTEQLSEIMVDVAGAVNKPGVYNLKAGSRVGGAIEAAGNFSVKADLAWVAKNLNLAAKLSDAAKIYIPTKGEVGQLDIQGSQIVTSSTKININSTTQSQLESLPAVGPVTAAKIILGRPYNTVEELLAKKVVGKSTFEKIKDLISVF